MQVQAETASANRKKASSIRVEEVINRIKKYDGVGLNPPEVWCLYEYILQLESTISGN